MLPSFSDDRSTILKRKGMLFALSSPSGVGKSTLAKLMLQETQATLSISATTRPPRGKEKDGKDYYFLTIEEFEAQRNKGAFLEWAKVHNNYYGTLKAPVESALSEGRDLIFDIDFQGVKQLKQHYQEDLVSIFILPPSMAELRRRLEERAEDSQETIDQRLEKAKAEMAHYQLYDYLLINKDLDSCFTKVKQIYDSERLRVKRNHEFRLFISQLLEEVA